MIPTGYGLAVRWFCARSRSSSATSSARDSSETALLAAREGGAACRPTAPLISANKRTAWTLAAAGVSGELISDFKDLA